MWMEESSHHLYLQYFWVPECKLSSIHRIMGTLSEQKQDLGMFSLEGCFPKYTPEGMCLGSQV